jgi:hypothetical protein
MTGRNFVPRLVGTEAETPVTVSGPVELDCSNAGSPPVLELAGGFVATFDCTASQATFTISPAS